MQITSGLFNNMVLQRNGRNKSEACINGKCKNAGALVMKVKSHGKPIKRLINIKIGAAKDGKFKGVLKGLPAGGPYDIEIFISDRQGRMLEQAQIKNVLVGDVWILGGQSNMEGIGLLKYAAKPLAAVRAFYMDDRWDIAKDPIHNLPMAVDQVHSDLAGGKPPQRSPEKGVGPGVAFGQEMLKRTGVPAVDLSFDDTIHISGFDQNRLGKRLAQAMGALRKEKKCGLPPIELFSVSEDKSESKSGIVNVRVKFRNVMGRLRSTGRPSGFSLSDGKNDVAGLFRTELEKDTVILKAMAPLFRAIHYGKGLMPYCNITDSADRSLPVLGPAFTTSEAAQGDFIVDWHVSRAMPSAGKLEKLKYPRTKKKLRLRRRVFTGGLFCDLHTNLFACAPGDVLVYFANRLYCPQRMKIQLCLGYDGPIKVWLDGQEVYSDPKGTNPASPPDKAVIPWKAGKGKHEVVIALGSNNGKAWGIYARFLRRDVPRHILLKGPASYAMPGIMPS
jgi:hypothetical protein